MYHYADRGQTDPDHEAACDAAADAERCPRCGCVADYFKYRTPFDTTPADITGCDECSDDDEEGDF
jgi:hypothetical protein